MISLILYGFALIFIFKILHRFFHPINTVKSKDMTGKVVIITGANSGIGYATALDLLKNGATVVFGCRNEDKTKIAIEQIKDESIRKRAIFIKINLSNFKSILNFVDEFKKQFLNYDILFNNAGGLIETFTMNENIEESLLTNYLGNLILTALLIKNIKPNGKIINMGSITTEFMTQDMFNNLVEDHTFSKSKSIYNIFKTYGICKLSVLIHTRYINKYLTKNKINAKAFSVNPGGVHSAIPYKFTHPLVKFVLAIGFPICNFVLRTCPEGAQTPLHIIYSENDKLNCGSYYNNCSEEVHNPIAKDNKNIEKLIEFTKLILKNNFKNAPNEISDYLSININK